MSGKVFVSMQYGKRMQMVSPTPKMRAKPHARSSVNLGLRALVTVADTPMVGSAFSQTPARFGSPWPSGEGSADSSLDGPLALEATSKQGPNFFAWTDEARTSVERPTTSLRHACGHLWRDSHRGPRQRSHEAKHGEVGVPSCGIGCCARDVPHCSPVRPRPAALGWW